MQPRDALAEDRHVGVQRFAEDPVAHDIQIRFHGVEGRFQVMAENREDVE